MCGIAGSVGQASPALLPAMLARIEHRGPDGRGSHVEPAAAIGMTRLAIIDLATGQQPIASEDGSHGSRATSRSECANAFARPRAAAANFSTEAASQRMPDVYAARARDKTL